MNTAQTASQALTDNLFTLSQYNARDYSIGIGDCQIFIHQQHTHRTGRENGFEIIFFGLQCFFGFLAFGDILKDSRKTSLADLICTNIKKPLQRFNKTFKTNRFSGKSNFSVNFD